MRCCRPTRRRGMRRRRLEGQPSLLSSSSGSTRGSTRHGTPSPPQKTTPTRFPAHRTHAYNRPIPPRIHCKALQRGGDGAGCVGKTQNLMHRARGNWSPSGDTGEAARVSDRPFRFMPRTARRACLCGTQGGRDWRMRRHRPPEWKGPEGDPFRPHRLACAAGDNGPDRSGNRRQTSTVPVLAEGPKSRAQTAERGAERCHVLTFKRGSFSAPSEMPVEPRMLAVAGGFCMALQAGSGKKAIDFSSNGFTATLQIANMAPNSRENR